MKSLPSLLPRQGYTGIFNIKIILYQVESKATFVVFEKMGGASGAQVRRALLVAVAVGELAAFTVDYSFLC
jgi:hypothetical protein